MKWVKPTQDAEKASAYGRHPYTSLGASSPCFSLSSKMFFILEIRPGCDHERKGNQVPGTWYRLLYAGNALPPSPRYRPRNSVGPRHQSEVINLWSGSATVLHEA